MLGSMVQKVLSKQSGITLISTSSGKDSSNYTFNVLKDSTGDLIQEIKPNYIINAIGIIKPRINEKNNQSVLESISINSVFPHMLNRAASENNASIIQIATDCVYSGKDGAYNEKSQHDPLDVYGKSKSLGEVESENFLNIRASIIGPEIGRSQSLLEWFKCQDESTKLKGFSNHLWNGVTTLQFARICGSLILEESKLHGTFHLIPANIISKYELLQVLNKAYFHGSRYIESVKNSLSVDRTLSTVYEDTNKMLWSLSGYQNIPSIEDMVNELAQFS